MPFYFINLLPTSLLYISILLRCERALHLCTTLEGGGGGGGEREIFLVSLSPSLSPAAPPSERSLKFVRIFETAPGGRGLPTLVNAAGVLRRTLSSLCTHTSHLGTWSRISPRRTLKPLFEFLPNSFRSAAIADEAGAAGESRRSGVRVRVGKRLGKIV